MFDLFHLIRQIRLGGKTKRLHSLHGDHENVASHTYGTLVLLHQLFPKFKYLWPYLLYHDTPEFLVGDVPATTKWASPTIKKELVRMERAIYKAYMLPSMEELNEEELTVLKNCDLLDLYIYSKECVETGNKYMLDVVSNIDRHCTKYPFIEPAQSVYQFYRTDTAIGQTSGELETIMEYYDDCK